MKDQMYNRSMRKDSLAVYITLWLSAILFISINLNAQEKNMTKIYDFKVKTIKGEETTLEQYKYKVLLIVNVASKCGYTPQYDGLETLYKKYKDQGFIILAFPSNEFGQQEPSSNENIKIFCTNSYDVHFDIFDKSIINGKEAIPLYKFLKSEQKGIFGTQAIKWNFTKFLVSKNGEVIKRYSPTTNPRDIQTDILTLL